jgi:hypothetical protein
MFAKKSEKALDKLINTPLIKLKRLIIKTQQKQNRPVPFDFIGDDSSVLDEAYNNLEMLLNSIQIQFQFVNDTKSTIILQKLSIQLFQKTKLISKYVNSFTINQKDLLIEKINSIVTFFIAISQNVNSGNLQIYNYISQNYENYLLPSFRIIKKAININDQRILFSNQPSVIPSTFSQASTPQTQSVAKIDSPMSIKRSNLKRVPVVWDEFDPDLLSALIAEMKLDDPKSITKNNLPNINYTKFKEFQNDDNNYKKEFQLSYKKQK